MMPRPRIALGFTLLELLVVLLIMGVVSATLIASVPDTAGGTALSRDASRLVSGLKTARARAISKQRTTVLAVDPSAKRLRIAGHRQRAGLELVSEVTLRAAAHHPMIPARMRFFPDGSADGGEFVLTDQERTLTVRVDTLTGRVTVRE